MLSFVPIVIFVVSKNDARAPVIQEERSVVELSASSSPQCALCAQIETEESRQQCIKDFACF